MDDAIGALDVAVRDLRLHHELRAGVARAERERRTLAGRYCLQQEQILHREPLVVHDMKKDDGLQPVLVLWLEQRFDRARRQRKAD